MTTAAVALRLAVLYTSGAITAVAAITGLRRHHRRTAVLGRLTILEDLR